MVPPASRARSITPSTSSADATLWRERDAAPARAVVGDTGVCRQLLPRPEDEHDAVRLEEGGLLDLEHRLPPERRVERVRLLVVAHPECDPGTRSASSARGLM